MTSLDTFYNLTAAVASQFFKSGAWPACVAAVTDLRVPARSARLVAHFTAHDEWVAANLVSLTRTMRQTQPSHRSDDRAVYYEWTRLYAETQNQFHRWLTEVDRLAAVCRCCGVEPDAVTDASHDYYDGRDIVRSDLTVNSAALELLTCAASNLFYVTTTDNNYWQDKARSSADAQRYVSGSYARLLFFVDGVVGDMAKLESRRLAVTDDPATLARRAVFLALTKPDDETARALYGAAGNDDEAALLALLDWFEENGRDITLCRTYLAAVAAAVDGAGRRAT